MPHEVAQMLITVQFTFWLQLLPVLVGGWWLKRLIFD